MVRLRDIVSRSKPVRISSDATVDEALVAMVENKTDFLIVNRTGIDDAYGMITTRDMIDCVVSKGLDMTSTSVVDCARKPVVVVNNMDLDIRWVAKKMANEKTSKLMVFDREDFLGFVSDVDILRAVAEKGRTGKTEASA
jgi:signal-transduction protein with cAMP-binding, CBS, and nucleotidyltransferase domain